MDSFGASQKTPGMEKGVEDVTELDLNLGGFHPPDIIQVGNSSASMVSPCPWAAARTLLQRPNIFSASATSVASCMANPATATRITARSAVKTVTATRNSGAHPPVSADTPAILTLNSFARGGDGGGKSFCDNCFHKDTELVVALSMGWLRLDGKRRCNKMIRINGNGRALLAKVVGECDSVYSCDTEHNFEPPCPYNDVDASPAVWKAMGLKEEIGVFKITWYDV
uniref:Ripening-related protein 4 n=1 Tax=Aegilops tauschii TaxID=37682 RepID=M8AXR6_AEGTA